MAAELILRQVTKTYQHGHQAVPALLPVDLTIKVGEFVCLIGPNGCGKSTLLKLIAGIEKPTAGSISLDLKSSYLPQQSSLLPWRTVEDNLLLPSDINRSTTPATMTRIRRLLKDFELLEFARLYPKALSGGMQQKVALLRSIMLEPGLLLLDEPFAPLDAITRVELQQWLLDLWHKTRPAVLCVTHDIREAIYLADTIYVCSSRPGRIIQRFSVGLSRPRRHQELRTATAKKLEGKLYELLDQS